MLEFIRQRPETFGADPDRVGFIGHGRGGTVALLAGARTNVDDYILSLAAPTSFFLPTVQEAARLYLLGQPFNGFPGLRDVLDATVGQVRDGTSTVEEARLDLLARSPALFSSPLPSARPPAFLFAAHGQIDSVVPDEHTGALDPLIRQTGGLYLSLPEVDHETILQNSQVLSTGRVFLCQRLLASEPICTSTTSLGAG